MPRVAYMTGWPTPMADTPAQNGNNEAGNNDSSRKTVALAGWATPVMQPANGTPERFLERKRESMARGAQSMGVSLSDLNMQVQAFAGWPSPTVGNADGSQSSAGATLTGRRPDGSKATVSLNAVAKATGPARLTVSGEMLTGSDARMANGGQLSPAHSLWLMLGPFATAWLNCAERVTRSTSRKRKVLSKPSILQYDL